MQPIIAAITAQKIPDVLPSTLSFDLSELSAPWILGDRILKWVADQGIALLEILPEKTIYIYVVDFHVDTDKIKQAGDKLFALDLNAAKNLIAAAVAPLNVDIASIRSPDDQKLFALSFSSVDKKFTTSINFKIGNFQYSIPFTFAFKEIQVTLPEMREFENMGMARYDNYSRNNLMMAFRLLVVDRQGKESKPSLPFPVWLPLPLVGEPDWRDMVTVGVQEKAKETEDTRSDYLGAAAVPDLDPRGQPTGPDSRGGQVRWYSLEPQALSELEFITSGESGLTTTPWPEKKLALTPPPTITSKLAALRRMGRWLTGKDLKDGQNFIYLWTDNCVKFKKPAGEEYGVVIIWRDDLPSKPLVHIDLQEYANRLIQSLWRPAKFEVETIDVGQTIELGVERLAEAANNALVKFLGNQLLVEFKFEIVRHDPEFSRFDLVEQGSQGADPKYLNSYYADLEPGEKGVSKQPLILQYIPDFNQKALPTSGEVALTVQLKVKLHTTAAINLLGQTLSFDGQELVLGEVEIHLKQLKLDTLALFFTEKDFKGPTMLMLPAVTTEIFDFLQGNQHIDVLTPSDLNTKRIQLFSALKSILQVFQLGQIFLSDSAKSAAEMIFQVIGFIVDKGTSVIDSTGAIAVLEDSIYAKNLMGDLFGKRFYESFDNHISSLILIGFPYSRTGTVVKCYVNRNFNLNKGEENGRVLELKNPGWLFHRRYSAIWKIRLYPTRCRSSITPMSTLR